MYILFVTLVSLVAVDVELEKSGFQTIDECWAMAEHVARSPEVFSVRCALEPDK